MKKIIGLGSIEDGSYSFQAELGTEILAAEEKAGRMFVPGSIFTVTTSKPCIGGTITVSHVYAMVEDSPAKQGRRN